MPVPEIVHKRSFVSELKFGTQKPRKRAIGCGFIRIRSKVFPLDGWASRIRTYECSSQSAVSYRLTMAQ